ncbi:PIG-L family deacetylase, partial [Candidatus Bathyarchaeota archaeon]|nr:PIG-L family deacetylase [Candidatus Bathyarchaeota archaeon]
MNNMGSILAIVSHPDDETFGCGGTLALHAAKNDDVKVLCLTCDPKDRLIEIKNACKELGISEPIVFNETEVSVNKILIKRVSDVIVALKPNIVFTHLPFDYHSDHKSAYSVVKEAIEWAAHTTTYSEPWLVERLMLMEINTLISTPHILIDVSDFYDSKKKAIQKYSSQLAKFNWGYYE